MRLSLWTFSTSQLVWACVSYLVWTFQKSLNNGSCGALHPQQASTDQTRLSKLACCMLPALRRRYAGFHVKLWCGSVGLGHCVCHLLTACPKASLVAVRQLCSIE